MHQRSDGQRFAQRPIDLAFIEQRTTLDELTLEFGVNRKTLGRAHYGRRDLDQRGALDTGLGRRRVNRHFDEGYAA